MDEWNLYLVIIFVLGGLFFLSAILALWWAATHGQLRQFERGAKTIFTEEEPEGIQSDFFPGEAKKARRKLEAERKD